MEVDDSFLKQAHLRKTIVCVAEADWCFQDKVEQSFQFVRRAKAAIYPCFPHDRIQDNSH